jgi:hypothetical protein
LAVALFALDLFAAVDFAGAFFVGAFFGSPDPSVGGGSAGSVVGVG